MNPEAKAAVILQGLSGHHLSGLLPGRDHKSAISAIAAGMGGWSGSGGHGSVTRQGIETYATVADACARIHPPTRITWAEVADIVAKGCEGGRREAYETALKEWSEFTRWSFDVQPGQSTKVDNERYARTNQALNAATAEIVRHGCAAETPQLALF